MTTVTRILKNIDKGDPSTADQLLPLVYDELRKLAAAQLVQEQPGQTLQATALVHEAYLRLVDGKQQHHWDSRGHFFAAAAESMRRILIENARAKLRLKRGGDRQRFDLNSADLVTALPPDEMLMLSDAIDGLSQHNAEAAELVKVRYFVGLSVEEAADTLGIPRSTAYRHWTYARAWLISRVRGRG